MENDTTVNTLVDLNDLDNQNIFTAKFLTLNKEVEDINLIKGRDLFSKLKGKIIGFRPDNVNISLKNRKDYFKAKVSFVRVIAGKNKSHLVLEYKNEEITVLTPSEIDISSGDYVWFYPGEYFIFDANSEELIEKKQWS